jgi:hypothetical protein
MIVVFNFISTEQDTHAQRLYLGDASTRCRYNGNRTRQNWLVEVKARWLQKTKSYVQNGYKVKLAIMNVYQ